jgi:hypothetical protein
VKGSCECGNELSGSIKLWEVLEWQHNWQLLKKGSAPWVSEWTILCDKLNLMLVIIQFSSYSCYFVPIKSLYRPKEELSKTVFLLLNERNLLSVATRLDNTPRLTPFESVPFSNSVSFPVFFSSGRAAMNYFHLIVNKGRRQSFEGYEGLQTNVLIPYALKDSKLMRIIKLISLHVYKSSLHMIKYRQIWTRFYCFFFLPRCFHTWELAPAFGA